MCVHSRTFYSVLMIEVESRICTLDSFIFSDIFFSTGSMISALLEVVGLSAHQWSVIGGCYMPLGRICSYSHSCTSQEHTASYHHMTSRHITLHRIISHHIISHHIASNCNWADAMRALCSSAQHCVDPMRHWQLLWLWGWSYRHRSRDVFNSFVVRF